MKVLFDHDLFYQPIGGASKYFVMLLKYMPRDMWETSTILSCNEYAKNNKIMPAFSYNESKLWSHLQRINIQFTKYKLWSGRFDVYHQTNYGLYGFDALKQKPMVTTFHDANQATVDPVPTVLEKQKQSLRRADAIIVVSENTKNEMLQLFDVDEKKVTVIHHGIEIPEIEDLPTDRIIENPYILYVGRRSFYKNFKRFAFAYSLLHQIYPEIKLVCTANPITPEETEMFKSLNILNSVIQVRADETTMSLLYRDALFFVFPSLSEGFGMPILEAWAHHCPVALSNTSCFPEIAGDAGMYFNPNEEEEMYDVMRQLTESENKRKELIERGNIRVRLFSWQESVRKHIEVYRSLV